ncbi:hypothetical protein [Cyclobacterium jeungdonense]|uniref:Class I SAM-dependent methyltransferase n=1 Tax=Cyclobacterium jeungdonense TaxID=708087 RepID=A0ABT8C8B7_9BACT|nr:hypothetical protein [Cyclobacterium jeungdonense]MDN3687916.1 hypothetical protein [Cyclobacterium jeungdonense]
MGRLHLFEFEDQRWFPAFLRTYMTDFLEFLSNKTGMFKPIVPMILELLSKSQTKTIIDLGSGSGGALLGLSKDLIKKIPQLNILLTDFYPNTEAMDRINSRPDKLRYEPRPIDAKNVPAELQGLRTLFLSFHHFKPADATLILQNALDSKNPIAIFEAQERSLTSILAMLFSPVTVWLTTPFIRPFSFGRILFTYFLPLVPVFVLWDGVVSALRTYSVVEMSRLVEDLKGKEHFEWSIGKIASGPSKILYLTGTLKKRKHESR